MERLRKTVLLFVTGGGVYLLIEMIWRAANGSNPTHWAMFFIGGLLFVLLGGMNELLTYDMSFIGQCLLGALVVTTVELISGYALNICLGLNIWDYSGMAYNVMGQICPQFSLAWFALSGLAIVLDDYIRHWLFGEEKPHYKLI